MKKIIKIAFSILFISNTLIINAQEFQGKAVYQTKVRMDNEIQKRLDSSKMPKERKAFFMKMIKKKMERVYVLNFNKTSSLFKEQKALEAPSENSRFNRSANNVLFKDIKNNKFVSKKETFGKIFLINDDLINYKWKLEKETKMIGKHLCLKATTIKEMKNISRFSRFSKMKEKKEADSTKVIKTIQVTAWYTPEIPVNTGPKDYHGLPGLILEINTDKLQILCTKIVLNPKEKTAIIAPNKGKEITQEAYNEIVKKKSREMRERYKNNRKKSGSFRGHRH